MILYSFPITDRGRTTTVNLHDSDDNAMLADESLLPHNIHFAIDSGDVYCEAYTNGCVGCAFEYTNCDLSDLLKLTTQHTNILQTHPELFI